MYLKTMLMTSSCEFQETQKVVTTNRKNITPVFRPPTILRFLITLIHSVHCEKKNRKMLLLFFEYQNTKHIVSTLSHLQVKRKILACQLSPSRFIPDVIQTHSRTLTCCIPLVSPKAAQKVPEGSLKQTPCVVSSSTSTFLLQSISVAG